MIFDPRLRRFFAVAIVAFLLAGAAFATAAPDYRVVVETDSGERIASVPADDGTEIHLSYTHSVEKTPVRETYVVEGSSLRQTRIEFSSYGWGFDSTADVERTDNGTFVARPDARFSELYVKPGRIAGHTVTIGEETYDLYDATGGETVRIYVIERSILVDRSRN